MKLSNEDYQRVWDTLRGLCKGSLVEFSRIYRGVALWGFPMISVFFVAEFLRVEHQTRQPAQYEFTASTIIRPSCSPGGNCTTRTDYRKTYRSADECMGAIRTWFSFKTHSTVDIIVDASCRVVGLGEPMLGPVGK